MKKTIFRTPVITACLRWPARLALRLTGWQVRGDVAGLQRLPRYVLIGAPHTSNWDFVLMLAVILACRMEVHWMGKHTLFPWPVGGFMRWLGGIAIDRRQANNTVAQMVEAYRQYDELVVLIPPEGTRRQVARWKSGFYHIAHQAGVPIVLGFIDAGRKEAGFGPAFTPTGDLEHDLAEIQAFYADKTGIRARTGGH